MQIEPSYTTIGKIFEQNFLFQVPKYQRYYAWEEEQIDDFIADFDKMLCAKKQDKDVQHFFGGVVCVAKTVAGSNRQQRELIDGQQRITTTILLIIAVYREYEKIKRVVTDREPSDLIESRLKKIEEKYLYYKDEVNRRPQTVNKLELSEADDAFFRNIIVGGSISPLRESHSKMIKSYKKLAKYVEKGVSEMESNENKMDFLAEVEDIIHNNCCIIFIDTKTKKDAFVLFQVLNDRGTGLTVGDLLKSKTLEILEAKPDKQQIINTCWDDILQRENKHVENFLRYYYMSVLGKRAGGSSLYDDFIKNIFKIEDTNAEYTDDEMLCVLSRMQTIYEENIIFNQIAVGDWPYEVQQPITAWDSSRLKNLIKYLDYDITLALLLAASRLEQKKFAEIVLLLERFMFRFKGICNNNHQKLSELFMKEAIFIRENVTTYRVSHLRDQLSALITSEASEIKFRANLQALKYIKKGNNKTLKYLFATLEEYHTWYDQGATGRPSCDTGRLIDFDNVTIEHIASQHPEEVQEGITDVNEIKNLTLLTMKENGELAGNKRFSEKKNVYHSSVFTLNTKINEYDHWDEETMTSWENHILDMACKVFII